MENLPHEDRFLRTLSGFESARPFNPISPFSEQREALRRKNQEVWDQIWSTDEPEKQAAAAKLLDQQQVEWNELDERERTLFHPADVLRAAHLQYESADELLGVPLLRLGRAFGLDLKKSKPAEDKSVDLLVLIASDLAAWIVAQVRMLESIGVAVRLMLDPEGKSPLTQRWKPGFVMGYKKRPRFDGLNMLRTQELQHVRAICAGLADVLESADWMEDLYDKRHQLVHGFMKFLALPSWPANTWVTNCQGWPGQIIDTEAYAGRMVVRCRDLAAAIAGVMDSHLKAAFPGYGPGTFGLRRSDCALTEALKGWEEVGRERLTSIALVVPEPGREKARELMEQLTSRDPDPRTKCDQGHKIAAEATQDRRGRTVFRARCACGVRLISSELEDEVVRHFVQRSESHFDRPGVPTWRSAVRDRR